jgi:acid stress-induced BolA-like protein IbaG/YrbA
MRDNKALKLKKIQSVHSRFKAYLEDKFIRVLSFEITIPMAWTRIDR